jgi:hypothetical protein
MADYRWVDQGTGSRNSLAISPTGLPLFLGHIAMAFSRLFKDQPRHLWSSPGAPGFFITAERKEIYGRMLLQPCVKFAVRSSSCSLYSSYS